MLDRITVETAEGRAAIALPTGDAAEVAQAIEYAAAHGLMVRADTDEMDGWVMTAEEAAAYDGDRAPGEPLIVTELLSTAEHEEAQAQERRARTEAKRAQWRAKEAREEEARRQAEEARRSASIRDAAARMMAGALADFDAQFGSKAAQVTAAAECLSCPEVDALAGLLLALGDPVGARRLLDAHTGPAGEHQDRHRESWAARIPAR